MKSCKKHWQWVLGGIGVQLILSACASSPSPSQDEQRYGQQIFDDEDTGVALYYAEKDADGDAYRSRWFVNKAYIHMTDTRQPQDFILFDRAAQTIYSVNSNDKTIFVIKPELIVNPPPIPIDYVDTSQPSAAIPKVAGKPATHTRYDANGVQCYDVVTMEADFLPEVVAALMEYRTVLAGEHASTLSRMPIDTLDACDLGLNVFYATKHLQKGLPIREWDQHGFQRFLEDYHTKFKLDPEAFKLPAGYKQYSIDQ